MAGVELDECFLRCGSTILWSREIERSLTVGINGKPVRTGPRILPERGGRAGQGKHVKVPRSAVALDGPERDGTNIETWGAGKYEGRMLLQIYASKHCTLFSADILETHESKPVLTHSQVLPGQDRPKRNRRDDAAKSFRRGNCRLTCPARTHVLRLIDSHLTEAGGGLDYFAVHPPAPRRPSIRKEGWEGYIQALLTFKLTLELPSSFTSWGHENMETFSIHRFPLAAGE